jgi:hypothetical protein
LKGEFGNVDFIAMAQAPQNAGVLTKCAADEFAVLHHHLVFMSLSIVTQWRKQKKFAINAQNLAKRQSSHIGWNHWHVVGVEDDKLQLKFPPIHKTGNRSDFFAHILPTNQRNRLIASTGH